MTLDMMERHVIEAAYRFHRLNKSATAAALGISVRTLDNKLAQYTKEEEGQKAAEAERVRQRTEALARARGTLGRSVVDSYGELAAATAVAASGGAPAPSPAAPAPKVAAAPKPADAELDELLTPRKGRT